MQADTTTASRSPMLRFLRALRTICDRHGIVLIGDEVQAGMARTGRMFGFDHAGVAPALVTMAKGLAGASRSRQ